MIKGSKLHVVFSELVSHIPLVSVLISQTSQSLAPKDVYVKMAAVDP